MLGCGHSCPAPLHTHASRSRSAGPSSLLRRRPPVNSSRTLAVAPLCVIRSAQAKPARGRTYRLTCCVVPLLCCWSHCMSCVLLCCRWLGVPALTDCLSEQLDVSASDLTPLAAIGSVSLASLQALLTSPDFAAAAFSIAATHATAVPSLRLLDMGAVARLCAAAGQGGRLRLVRRLATRVVLRADSRDVTRDTTARQVGEVGMYGWHQRCHKPMQSSRTCRTVSSASAPACACGPL